MDGRLNQEVCLPEGGSAEYFSGEGTTEEKAGSLCQKQDGYGLLTVEKLVCVCGVFARAHVKMDDATTPGRKGNLTGSARKLKDNAADWHNFILKWEHLSDEGSTIATKIVNFTLSKESVKEPEVMMEGQISSAAPALRSAYHGNPELEKECSKLQSVVDKMTHILSKMEKMVSAEKGICELETFQYGESGRPTPLFQTWSTQYFAEGSSGLYDAYKQELALKSTILRELAHTTNLDLCMVYLSCWLYQPYIQDDTKLLLESLLMETGYRAI